MPCSTASLKSRAPRPWSGPWSGAMLWGHALGHALGPCSGAMFQERVSRASFKCEPGRRPAILHPNCAPSLPSPPPRRVAGTCQVQGGLAFSRSATLVCDPLAIRDASDLLRRYQPPVLQRCHSPARGLRETLLRELRRFAVNAGGANPAVEVSWLCRARNVGGKPTEGQARWLARRDQIGEFGTVVTTR